MAKATTSVPRHRLSFFMVPHRRRSKAFRYPTPIAATLQASAKWPIAPLLGLIADVTQTSFEGRCQRRPAHHRARSHQGVLGIKDQDALEEPHLRDRQYLGGRQIRLSIRKSQR